ncbi:MAG: hypothetical protein IJZ65_07340, partial [Ruminiclostridium sp.]|nr:hypothetical protein [Ruminiclostridium sp.]
VYASTIVGKPFLKGLSLGLPSENFQIKFKTHRRLSCGSLIYIKSLWKRVREKAFLQKGFSRQYSQTLYKL